METRAIFRRTGRILQQILVNIQSAPTLPFEDANIIQCVFLWADSSFIRLLYTLRLCNKYSCRLSDWPSLVATVFLFKKKSCLRGRRPFNTSEGGGGTDWLRTKRLLPLTSRLNPSSAKFFLSLLQPNHPPAELNFWGQLIWLFIFPSILRLFVQDQTYILPNPVVANIWKLFIGGICFCCPE